MGKSFPALTPSHLSFIRQQRVFYVASAPLSPHTHVNVSPKGLVSDCLCVLSPTAVAYVDLTGSGNETSAHLLENGRITLLFNAFEGEPLILRIFGEGRVILPSSTPCPSPSPSPSSSASSASCCCWAHSIERHFSSSIVSRYPSIRQLVVVDIHSVRTSCGYGVPLYSFVGNRENIPQWAQAMSTQQLIEYRLLKNTASLDSLPTHLSVENERKKGEERGMKEKRPSYLNKRIRVSFSFTVLHTLIAALAVIFVLAAYAYRRV